MRLTPAIRYTRWQADKAGARTVPDQVEVTMEISKARLLAPRNAARRLYFGIVVGGTLTKDFGTETFGQTVSGSGPRSVVPGAMIECRLHRGLSVEVDALDRRRHYYYSTRVSQVGGTASQQTFEGVAQNWELPLLAKYRSGIPIWRTDAHPIFEAGPSFRTRHDLSGASRHGFTAGMGIEFRLSKLRIAPVIRYTRWGAGQPVGSSNATMNDAQALAVLSF